VSLSPHNTQELSKCTVLVRQKGKNKQHSCHSCTTQERQKPASLLLQLTEISNKQYCPYISYQRISHIKNNKKKCLIVVVVVVGLESLKFLIIQ